MSHLLKLQCLSKNEQDETLEPWAINNITISMTIIRLVLSLQEKSLSVARACISQIMVAPD